MAPTELMREAPTDGEEWFLRRNARKDRQREDSESESLVTATSVTSSPAAHDRLVFPQIQGEVAQ